MGKIIALFLIAYFGMYLYRKWQYKKNNSIGQIKYYEQELAKRGHEDEESDIIDVDTDDDDSQRPKYLH